MPGHIARWRAMSCFLAFWLFVIVSVMGRIVFDVRGYFFGSTLVFRDSTHCGYDYIVRLPRETLPNRKCPLLLFLHGAGDVGKDVTYLKKCDVGAFSDGLIPSREFPFIVVCPVTKTHGWNSSQLNLLLEEVTTRVWGNFGVDTDRIYVTGLSMGGFGTFRIASEYPDRFAAIAPICGGGKTAQAERLKSVPTWIFHGDSDEVVSWTYSSEMAEAMRSAGGDEVIFTTIPGGGHEIWQEVYENPELYRWLLKHQRKR